jgi:hypothetical protein
MFCDISNDLVIVELEVLLPGSDILGYASGRAYHVHESRSKCGLVYHGGELSDGIMRSRMVTWR